MFKARMNIQEQALQWFMWVAQIYAIMPDTQTGESEKPKPNFQVSINSQPMSKEPSDYNKDIFLPHTLASPSWESHFDQMSFSTQNHCRRKQVSCHYLQITIFKSLFWLYFNHFGMLEYLLWITFLSTWNHLAVYTQLSKQRVSLGWKWALIYPIQVSPYWLLSNTCHSLIG